MEGVVARTEYSDPLDDEAGGYAVSSSVEIRFAIALKRNDECTKERR